MEQETRHEIIHSLMVLSRNRLTKDDVNLIFNHFLPNQLRKEEKDRQKLAAKKFAAEEAWNAFSGLFSLTLIVTLALKYFY